MNSVYSETVAKATEFFHFAERHGFALHEVHAGDKAPIGADWQHRNSRDPAAWRGWLSGGHNIGLHPGTSRVAVLDIEAGKQEIAAEWFLKITGYSLPDPHVRSPSGGTHTYFRLVDATGLSTLRQRTTGWGDLLVGSANAMLPPSYFANAENKPDKKAGPYEWLGNEMLYDGEILRPAWQKRAERINTAPALDGFNRDRVARWIDRKVAGEWKDDPTALSQLDWTMLGAAMKLHFGDAGLELFQRMSHDRDQAERRWDKFPSEYSEGDRTLHWYLNRDIDWMFGDTLDVLNGKLVLPSPVLVPLPPGTPLPGPCEWYELPPNLIQSSGQFVRDFVPPDYVVDRIFQRRFCYSMTAKTGGGKTAAAMRLAAHVATGRPIGSIEVEKGTVIYAAGENPTDVQARWLGVTEEMGIDPDAVDVHFINGVVKISENVANIDAEVTAKNLKPALVIVDTVAAYFEGDDDNDNVQMGNYARLLRSMTTLPGGPCVLALAHPTKRAADDDLIPKGGGAFLNEVDGNVALRRNGQLIAFEALGKFRGPSFEPVHFELVTVQHPRLRDTKGRPIPTVVARPVSDVSIVERERANERDEDALLRTIDQHPRKSRRDIGKLLGMSDSRVYRLAQKLEQQKLIRSERSGWSLTGAGERELNAMDSRGSVVNQPPLHQRDSQVQIERTTGRTKTEPTEAKSP